MLAYKAWRESRARFVLGAGVLVWFCASFVSEARHNFPPRMDPDLPYSVFVWRGIFNGPDTLLLVLVALMLGLGGLLRERASGFAVFTLSLPVKRWQILVSRALVGEIGRASCRGRWRD